MGPGHCKGGGDHGRGEEVGGFGRRAANIVVP